jgi:hypothetical protein
VRIKQNCDGLSGVTNCVVFCLTARCLLSMDRQAVIWNEAGSGRGQCEAVRET